MSTTLDRLRRLQALREQRQRGEPAPLAAASTNRREDWPVAMAGGRIRRLEELVPGQVVENACGFCYQATSAVPLHHQRGSHALGDLLRLQPAALAQFHPEFGLTPAVDFSRAAFIDTETTGLGAGASVYCFMIGVGAFERWEEGTDEPTHFVVRQLFMRNPAEEGALLLALAELLAPYTMTVTFNGRGFDLPLLRTRYRYNRHMLPATGPSGNLLQPDQPHLDLLPPARRLWRRRLQSCRLLNLERSILDQQRTEDDVPGHLIPQLYSDYLRSGDARDISRIFYHNREDIISTAALAERLSQAFGQGCDPGHTGDLHGLDWLSLGRSYEARGQLAAAESAYRRALDAMVRPSERAEAYAALGQLLKRQGQWAAAVDTWQQWLGSVPGDDPTPFVELAKYSEWQARDLAQAAMWAGWALHNLRRSRNAAQWNTEVQDLEHRLARIQRKLGGAESSTDIESE